MSRPGTKSPPRKGQQNKQQPRQQTKAPKSAEEIAQAQTRAQAAQEALDAKKEARMQRQAVALAAAQRRRMRARLRRFAIIGALALVIVGGGVAYAMVEANKPGELVPMLPSTPHISSVDAPHAPYNTTPPTSGPHVQEVPGWTVHTEQVRDELAVHGLEDGGVIVNYRPDLDKATVDRLAELTRSYADHVLMTPYEGLSHPIVLTAWRRIDRLDNFDEARMKRFIDTYRGKDHHGESGS